MKSLFEGAHVIMCCRSVQKGIDAMKSIKNKLPNAILTLKKLDLASTKSIRNFTECIGKEKKPKIFLFFNKK